MSRSPPISDGLSGLHEETVIQSPSVADVLEGRWRIEKRIGSGSMGSVFAAWDLERQEKVAIKILSPELCRKRPFIARFEREARLMKELRHPNLVPLLAIGRRGALPYLVMPYLEGTTLAEYLQRRAGKLGSAEAQAIIQQVCAGLVHLHRQKLVHRDIKPQNIFLAPDGHVTVLDLGVARDQMDPGLTRPGVRIGTPYYMAPEQILGAPDVDHRADVYALGAVVFELLTGAPPFLGENHHEVLRAHRENPAPDASTRSRLVSREAAAVLTRALAKAPEDRFPSVHAFLNALENTAPFIGEPEEEDFTRPEPALTGSHAANSRVATGSATSASFDTDTRPGLEQPPPPPLGADIARLTTERRPRPNLTGPRSVPVGGSDVALSSKGGEDTDRARPSSLPTPRAYVIRDAPSIEILDTGFELLKGSTQELEPQQKTEPGAPIARLHVIPVLAGVPGRAEVFCDGKCQGDEDALFVVAPGKHRVRVQREGFHPRELDIEISAGERSLLRVALEPSNRP